MAGSKGERSKRRSSARASRDASTERVDARESSDASETMAASEEAVDSDDAEPPPSRAKNRMSASGARANASAESAAGAVAASARRWWRRQRVSPRGWATLAILLLAIGLRLPFAAEGLPYSYNWDEPLVLHNTLDMLRTETLVPDYWMYPHLYFYAQYAAASASYIQVAKSGFLKTVNTIPTNKTTFSFWDVPHERFYWNGRLLTVLFGALIVWQVGWLAKRLGSGRASVLAMLFAAVHPILVRHSAFATTDVPASAMALFCAMACVQFLKSKDASPRWLFLAALAAGLTAATKYTFYSVAAAPVIAWLVAPARRRLFSPALLLIPFGVGVGFLVGMPGAIARTGSFLFFIADSLRRFDDDSASSGLFARMGRSLAPMAAGTGLKLLLAAGLGGCAMAFLAARGRPRVKTLALLPLLAAGLLQWKSSSRFTVYFERYVVFIAIALVLVPAAILLAELAKAERPRWLRRAALGVAAATVLGMLWSDFVAWRAAREPDPRTLAVAYVNEKAKEGDVVVAAGELQLYRHDLRPDLKLVELNRAGLAIHVASMPKVDWILAPQAVTMFEGTNRTLYADGLKTLSRAIGDELPAKLDAQFPGRPMPIDGVPVRPGAQAWRLSGSAAGATFSASPAPRTKYLALEANGPASAEVNTLPGATLRHYSRFDLPVNLPNAVKAVRLRASARKQDNAWPMVSVALRSAENGALYRAEPIAISTDQWWGGDFVAAVSAPAGRYVCEIAYTANSRDLPNARPPFLLSTVSFE